MTSRFTRFFTPPNPGIDMTADDQRRAFDRRDDIQPTGGLVGDRRAGMRDLQWENYYDPRTGVLHANWDEGFFSNCTTALWALTDLAAEGLAPARICMDRGWDKYCDRGLHKDLDLYDVFFKPQPDLPAPIGTALPRLHHHGRYALLGLERWTPFIQRWFAVSERVADLQRSLVAGYEFDRANTIGFFYRGTDKYTEVAVVSRGEFMRLARALTKTYPHHRIMLQTDQAQVRDLFAREFGTRCFHVKEMPATGGTTGLHFLSDAELGMDRMQFGMLGLAVTRLLAECDVLVNGTGNMALWAALYRGNTNRMYQVDETGDVVDPSGRDFRKDPVRVLLRALKRIARPLRLGRIRRLLSAKGNR